MFVDKALIIKFLKLNHLPIKSVVWAQSIITNKQLLNKIQGLSEKT